MNQSLPHNAVGAAETTGLHYRDIIPTSLHVSLGTLLCCIFTSSNYLTAAFIQQLFRNRDKIIFYG